MDTRTRWIIGILVALVIGLVVGLIIVVGDNSNDSGTTVSIQSVSTPTQPTTSQTTTQTTPTQTTTIPNGGTPVPSPGGTSTPGGSGGL